MSISFAQDRSVSKIGRTKRKADAAVLVVGNNLDVAEEIRFELQAGGHPVWLSQTTRDALRAVRSGWPSVLVVDRALNMERMASQLSRPCVTRETSRRFSWSVRQLRSTSGSTD